MNTLGKMLTLILGLALSSGPLSGEPSPERLTVSHAVDLAVRNNLDVRNAGLEVAIQQRMKDHSFNVLFPTISTGITASRLNDPAASNVYLPAGPPSYVTVVTPDSNNLSLSLKIQEIFTPAILAQFAQLDDNLSEAKITREQAVRSVTASVRKFFYQLLVQKESIELTQARLKNSEERLRQSGISYQLGQETELSYAQNQIDVDNLRPQLEQQKTGFTNSLVTFQELLGVTPRTDLILDGNLDDEPVILPPTPLLVAHRLNLRAEESQSNNLKTGKDLQVLGVLPALVFQYSADPNANGPQNLNLLDTNNWPQKTGALSMTLSWNLESFIPGSSFWDKTATFDSRIELARERALQIEQNDRDDIENRRRSIQTSQSAIASLKAAVQSTKRAQVLTEAAYKLGTGRLLDLQAAELNNQSTQILLLNEELNLKGLVLDLESQLDVDLESLYSQSTSS